MTQKTLKTVIAELTKTAVTCTHTADFLSQLKIYDEYNKTLKNYSTIDNFGNDLMLIYTLNTMPEVDRKKLLSDEGYCNRFLDRVDEEYAVELHWSDVKLLIKNATNHQERISLSWMFAAIEDFNNVTDEEIKHLYDEDYRFMDVYVSLFGDRVKDMLYAIEDDRQKELQRDDMSKEIREEILVNAPKPIKVIWRWIRGFESAHLIKLCEKDDRYIPQIIDYLDSAPRGEANKVWENSNEVARYYGNGVSFPDLYRYLFIIAQCCINKQIPAYQATKLKEYAPLMKMHNWNFDAMAEIVKGNFAATGKVKITIPKVISSGTKIVFTLSTPEGRLMNFKTEEDRDNIYTKYKTAFPNEVYEKRNLDEKEFKFLMKQYLE